MKNFSAIDRPSAHSAVVLLFDLTATGHHPVFIRYLAKYWSQVQHPGTLQIVVSPKLIKQCPDIPALAYTTDSSRIQFTTVSEQEAARALNQTSIVAKSWAMWKVFCQYANKLGATEAVLMYVDIFQIPLALGAKAPCPIAGIYFRPTFHYSQFSSDRSTVRDRVRAWRQKTLLAQMLKHSQFKTLFSMDWFAVDQIQKLQPQVKVLPLADPITLDHTNPDIESVRNQLKIERDRKVFLLFGKISNRKGVLEVLEAIQSLRPDAAKQICLLIVGRIDLEERSRIQTKLAELSNTPSQIIVQDHYYDESSLQAYLKLADVILAPYQQHIGTCATMLHAATAGKPVIVSDYGLMGELARQYELGLVINSRDIAQISRSLIDCLDNSKRIGNPESMKDFAQANLWTRYAQTIVETFNS